MIIGTSLACLSPVNHTISGSGPAAVAVVHIEAGVSLAVSCKAHSFADVQVMGTGRGVDVSSLSIVVHSAEAIASIYFTRELVLPQARVFSRNI